MEKHGIPYHEKKLGQLFCDRAASDVVSMLERECLRGGSRDFCQRHYESERGRRREDEQGEFTVQTEGAEGTEGAIFSARSLVVATGGLSIAKIGATSFGYDLARQFGLNIIPPRAALVPLLFREPRPQALVRPRRSIHRSCRFDALARKGVPDGRFAKICFSLIVELAGRRFCKFLLIGMRTANSRFISISLRAVTSPLSCKAAAIAIRAAGGDC